MSTLINKGLLIYHTVRYMKARQWKYRLYYLLREKVFRRKPCFASERIEAFPLRTCYGQDIHNASAVETADKICNNEIPAFAGAVCRYHGDWEQKEQSYRLLTFKLNSFHWLMLLSDAYKATGDQKYISKGMELISQWNEKCGKVIRGDPWNAYVIAERICNWIGFCSEYSSAEQLVSAASWIFTQAYELKKSLEFQLGANHLLSEAKALICAGIFLREETLYETGKKVLFEEIEEQFLPDGGHYERSVSYHVEALQQCFEAFALLRIREDPDAERLAGLMRQPYRFLNGMIGADGRIPLFNDAAVDYPFYDAADFLGTAAYLYADLAPNASPGKYSERWHWLEKGSRQIDWEEKDFYDKTGFMHYRFASGGNNYSLFFDCGEHGPAYNLGHTHADALSLLLCSQDKSILADSGVFTYQPGKERDYCRSTVAHNTVEIDGENSAEVWSAFRVARRGSTKVRHFSDQEGLLVSAAHDGYEKCLNAALIHERTVRVTEGQIEIVDQVANKGNHSAIARFHLAPGTVLDRQDENTCCIDGHILVRADQPIRITACEVAERFGLKEKAACLEIDFREANVIKTVFHFM